MLPLLLLLFRSRSAVAHRSVGAAVKLIELATGYRKSVEEGGQGENSGVCVEEGGRGENSGVCVRRAGGGRTLVRE